MEIKRSSSIYKKITSNRQSLLRHMPESLQQAIAFAYKQHYDELYESGSDGTVLLEDALERILNSFQSNYQFLSQLRYVWMALTFAVIVEPTIRYYQPDNLVPEETIKQLENWIQKNSVEMFSSKKQLNEDIKNSENITLVDVNHLFSEKNISSFQVLSEALDVYINAIKTLEPKSSLQALLDILDDCLEGYAIFPGSYGRRELFNWWLLDVVPSCWYLLPPRSIYPLQDFVYNNSNLTLQRLEETSKLIWSLIEAAIAFLKWMRYRFGTETLAQQALFVPHSHENRYIQNKNGKSEDFLSFHNKTFSSFNNEIYIPTEWDSLTSKEGQKYSIISDNLLGV